jgi:hypothetical protein
VTTEAEFDAKWARFNPARKMKATETTTAQQADAKYAKMTREQKRVAVQDK